MTIDEACELQQGDTVITTRGERVTFVELAEREADGVTRARNVAVIEADGDRREVPPRSLHHPRTVCR